MYTFTVRSPDFRANVIKHLRGEHQDAVDWLNFVEDVKVDHPLIGGYRYTTVSFELPEDAMFTAAEVADNITEVFECDVIVEYVETKPKRRRKRKSKPVEEARADVTQVTYDELD